MKKIAIILSAIFVTFAVTSCNKEDLSDPIPTNVTVGQPKVKFQNIEKDTLTFQQSLAFLTFTINASSDSDDVISSIYIRRDENTDTISVNKSSFEKEIADTLTEIGQHEFEVIAKTVGGRTASKKILINVEEDKVLTDAPFSMTKPCDTLAAVLSDTLVAIKWEKTEGKELKLAVIEPANKDAVLYSCQYFDYEAITTYPELLALSQSEYATELSEPFAQINVSESNDCNFSLIVKEKDNLTLINILGVMIDEDGVITLTGNYKKVAE